MANKVLLIGGSGSMGSYLSPLLLEKGYDVDVVCLDVPEHQEGSLRYINCNAKDTDVLKQLLSAHYDCVVDFLDYAPQDYLARYRTFLDNTGHYIFLSSYRAYSDKDAVTTEDSPLQIDVADDLTFRHSDDYSIAKARNERVIRATECRNWTIVRPSIIISRLSFPLVSLGADNIVNRARDGKATIIPEEALPIRATATYSGDVAKMFAGIILNPAALTETYTLATSEHLAWQTYVEYYKELLGLKTYTVPLEYFDDIYHNKTTWAIYQLHYDRMFNRVMDNSKILAAAGMTQADMTPIFDALKYEFERLPKDFRFKGPENVQQNIDRCLALNPPYLKRFC